MGIARAMGNERLAGNGATIQGLTGWSGLATWRTASERDDCFQFQWPLGRWSVDRQDRVSVWGRVQSSPVQQVHDMASCLFADHAGEAAWNAV